ncbi:MAG: MAPEG family protein [Sulfitobacter sp.]
MKMIDDKSKKQKFTRIILAYPVALVLLGLAVNFFVFGIDSATIAMPSYEIIAALILSAVMLLANHTWLMTSTELTRLKYNMHATPEEWEASENIKDQVSPEGLQELERRHNAHNNATENIVHFVLLAVLTSVVSPVAIMAQVWFLGFAVGRLGHTFSYLSGRDDLRGIFMSVSLISLYGLSSYLLLSLIV